MAELLSIYLFPLYIGGKRLKGVSVQSLTEEAVRASPSCSKSSLLHPLLRQGESAMPQVRSTRQQHLALLLSWEAGSDDMDSRVISTELRPQVWVGSSQQHL